MATTTAPPAQREQLPRSLRAGLVVAAAVSVVVFVGLATAVWHAHGYVGLDGSYGLSLWNPRLQRVAQLGSAQFVFPVAGLLALVSWARRDRFAVVLCAVAPPIAGLCDIAAKHVVGRIKYSAFSYPSGHAALTATLAAVVAVLAFRAFPWPGAVAVTVAAATVPAVVSVALVRLAWHYPTDVAGGMALGVGIVAGTALLLDLTSRRIRTN